MTTKHSITVSDAARMVMQSALLWKRKISHFRKQSNVWPAMPVWKYRARRRRRYSAKNAGERNLWRPSKPLQNGSNSDSNRVAQNRARLFRNRGLSQETVAKFRLGYAPPLRRHEPSRLTADLKKQGFENATLLEAGLLSAPDDGRAPYDFFRNRVIIFRSPTDATA